MRGSNTTRRLQVATGGSRITVTCSPALSRALAPGARIADVHTRANPAFSFGIPLIFIDIIVKRLPPGRRSNALVIRGASTIYNEQKNITDTALYTAGLQSMAYTPLLRSATGPTRVRCRHGSVARARGRAHVQRSHGLTSEVSRFPVLCLSCAVSIEGSAHSRRLRGRRGARGRAPPVLAHKPTPHHATSAAGTHSCLSCRIPGVEVAGPWCRHYESS